METYAEVQRIIDVVSKATKIDFEAVESAMRAAVLAAGASICAALLTHIGKGRRLHSPTCRCGQTMKSTGVERKNLMTILGPVPFDRSRYECPQCGVSRYPGDEELDVAGTTRSPGVRRMMARAGSRQPFKEAKDDLKIYAGIKVSAKDVERVAERIGEHTEAWQAAERETLMRLDIAAANKKSIPILYIEVDGTGVPMVPSEVQGRKGKQPDGTARTREVKLGCVFTQTARDDKGRPVRDAASSSFVGAIETVDVFSSRIVAEAIRRGLYEAEKVVVLGDGAAWIRQMTEMHFPQAMQIIDLYHAREHLSDLCKLLFPSDDKRISLYRMRWWSDLDQGMVEKIIREAYHKLPSDQDIRKRVEAEINYLSDNKERMRYAEFRRQGLFVGSGVVEAGCKHIIGARLKQSGMEWTVRGANAIISLRCLIHSGRFEDFWESRAA